MSSLSLLIPGLLGSPEFVSAVKSQPLSALDQLSQWIIETLPAARQFDQQLIRLLGGEIRHDEPSSLAYLLAKPHFAVDDAKRYLLALPVHLQADSGRLLMYGQDGLEIEPDEAEQWLAELSPILSRHGIEIYGASPESWVLCLPESLEVAAFSELSEVIGQDIHDYMPSGANSMFWRSLINELQMQLHQSNVNAKRQVMGLKAVNSLWIAGAGAAVSLNTTYWQSLCSDNSIARALAAQAGVEKLASLAAGDSVVGSSIDNRLVVDTHFAESSAREDLDHWYQALQLFHDTVAEPIVSALNKAELKEVQVYPVDGHCYRIRKPAGFAKFVRGFRKQQDFAQFMSAEQ